MACILRHTFDAFGCYFDNLRWVGMSRERREAKGTVKPYQWLRWGSGAVVFSIIFRVRVMVTCLS